MKKKRAIFILFVLFSALLITIFHSDRAFAASTPNISYSVDRSNIKTEEQFKIFVKVDNISNLYGAQIDYAYDSTMLKIVSVEEGSVFKNSGKLYSVTNNSFDNSSGKGRFVSLLLGDQPGLSTSGEIIVITAKAYRQGDIDLKFSSSTPTSTPNSLTSFVKFSNSNASLIPYTSSNNLINIIMTHGSEFVSDTIPSTMEVGKTYNVSITVNNLGTNTWTAAASYNLGAANDSDKFLRGKNRVIMNSSLSVSTGQSVTYSFQMTAPTTAGSYSSDWRMVQDGVTWFGPTFSKRITVTGSLPSYNSQYVSDTIPDTMVAGQTYNVSMTFKNTGANIWTGLQNYRLGVLGWDAAFMSTNRVNLPTSASVYAYDTVTYNFALTAPSSGGNFNTSWSMVQDGVTWFGQAVSKNILVLQPASPLSSAIISDTIPSNMEAGKVYDVSVTVKNTGSNTWSSANNYRLGVLGWNAPFMDTNRVLLPQATAYNNTVTFNFKLKAPYKSGSYNTTWSMVQDGVAWFGQVLSKNINVMGNVPPYEAQIVGTTIPSTMEAGKSYNVSMTVKNVGYNTWTSANNYRLGILGSTGTFIDTNRVQLPSSVYNGDSVTFNFILKAPTKNGSYNITWQMVQDGITWFGQTASTQISVNGGTPEPYGAQFVSTTIPDTMEAGKTYDVSVTLKNTGANAWTSLNNYRLGSLTWDAPFMNTNRVQLPKSVGYNETVTINFKLTAPSKNGTYNTSWKMVQDGIAWFGDTYTKAINVTGEVKPYDAQIISSSIPEKMDAGRSYNVSVTVKNTGSNTWTAANSYRLGVLGWSYSFMNTNRVQLPSSVAPNGTVTFNFTLTAPPTAGTNNIVLQMVQDGFTWFGPVLNKQITVSGNLQPYSSAFISSTIPAKMQPGKSYNVSVTLRNTGSNTWTTQDYYRLGILSSTASFINVNRFDLPSSVAPFGTATFNFTLTAPSQEGAYNINLQMVRDGVTWFGDSLGSNIAVTKSISSYDSQIIESTIPDVMSPGGTYNVSVTIRNTGSNVWTSASNYRLGALGLDVPFMNTNRVSLPTNISVSTDGIITLNFMLTAPTTPGTYSIYWQMVCDGITWFGNTLRNEITVN